MFKCKVRVSSHCCAHCLESEAIRASLGSEQNWKVPQTLWCSLEKVRGEYSSLLISSSDLHSFTEEGWLVLTPGPWLWPNTEESSIGYLGPDPWLLPAHMPSHHLGCLLPDLHDNRHLCEWLTFACLWTCFQPYWPFLITCSWAQLSPLSLSLGHPSTHSLCFTTDGTSDLCLWSMFLSQGGAIWPSDAISFMMLVFSNQNHSLEYM